MASELEILAPPSDGVSCMRFSHYGNKSHLLVSSWDAGLRVYDGVRLRVKVDMEQPVLACCYGGSDVEAFAGGLECTIKQVDLNTKQITAVGQHDAAVRSAEYSKEYGAWSWSLPNAWQNDPHHHHVCYALSFLSWTQDWL